MQTGPTIYPLQGTGGYMGICPNSLHELFVLGTGHMIMSLGCPVGGVTSCGGQDASWVR